MDMGFQCIIVCLIRIPYAKVLKVWSSTNRWSKLKLKPKLSWWTISYSTCTLVKWLWPHWAKPNASPSFHWNLESPTPLEHFFDNIKCQKWVKTPYQTMNSWETWRTQLLDYVAWNHISHEHNSPSIPRLWGAHQLCIVNICFHYNV
jgi:hypothetical protein